MEPELKTILDTVSLIGDLCIITITFYTFFLGFCSKKVTVESMGFFGGQECESICLIIKNHAMRAFYIRSISFVFGDKYIVKIGNYDIPMVLDAPLDSLDFLRLVFERVILPIKRIPSL